MNLQINDYRMKDHMLVRISDVLGGREYGFRCIAIVTEDGTCKAVDAGASNWFTADAFSPITDPKLIAAAKAFEANRIYEEMDAALDAAWADVLKWNGVLQCICEGEAAAVPA